MLLQHRETDGVVSSHGRTLSVSSTFKKKHKQNNNNGASVSLAGMRKCNYATFAFQNRD